MVSLSTAIGAIRAAAWESHMRRREFIALFGGAAALGPSAGAAQERVWRVGLLSNSPPPSGRIASWRNEVLHALAQNGFAVGKNLELVERYSGDEADRLPPLAREINAAGADAIVAISEESVLAALAATKTTPIVMVIGVDPLRRGLVTSFAHPGGRVTGIYMQTLEGDAKRLELLKEAIPGARRLGYLGMSYQRTTTAELMASAAAQLGIELAMHWVDGPAEYASAFAAMKNEGVAAAVVGANQPLAVHSREVAASATENGLPTICEWDYMARDGCVFGFGHDLDYAQHRIGEYVVRILKGTLPAELPVERPDAWKLTINMSIARRLGLTIPHSILARADQVIE
jgi:putative tryptophan/tyrosine transport system substrate-binding protein